MMVMMMVAMYVDGMFLHPQVAVLVLELLGMDIHPRAWMSTHGREYLPSGMDVHARTWISIHGLDVHALAWTSDK
jgi:hypothetical protein